MPVDIGSIKRNDQIAGAAAILAFILALIPGVRTADVKDEFRGPGVEASDSVNLWHGLGVLAALLLLVAVAGLVVTILGVSGLEALPVRWITTGVLGLATLLSLIYIFTYSFDAPSGVDAGDFLDMAAGWAGYLLVLLGIVATVFAALGALESGEQLPGRGSSTTGGATPPPAA